MFDNPTPFCIPFLMMYSWGLYYYREGLIEYLHEVIKWLQ